MSGLEVTAADVGITDVAIRSIRKSYDFVKDIQEAPEAVARLRTETTAVVRSLESLEFPKSANGEVQKLVTQVGLAEAVNRSGVSCADLNDKLAKWTRSDDGLVRNLRFSRHQGQVAKCCQQIRTAKGTVGLAVNLASLAMSAASSSAADNEKKRQQLKKEISELQEAVRGQREAATQTALALQKRIERDEGDLDAELAIIESKQQLEACDQLWANCLVAEHELHTLAKVDVTVGHVVADTQSQNHAGVPEVVIKKVDHVKVKVGNMTATRGSVNKIGIYL
ncbi:hypothetical protein KC349_g8835 [Hortaea werneckii]|nr:hypothetical protein KC349_g8835 [Hortaea werneckii]